MSIKTWIANGIVRREMTGEIILEDLLESLGTTTDHPDFQKGMPAIWDMRNATLRKLSKDDLFKIRGAISKKAGKRGINFKVAYVVSSDLDYGICRMLENILWGSPNCSRGTFRSISDAIAWIEVPLENGWEKYE